MAKETDWFNFLLKVKPDGRAFSGIEDTKTMLEVMANALSLIADNGVAKINDQIWYVNDQFDPEPWEERYQIDVSEFSTIEERSEIVKGYMLYPKYQNRLSRDYIQRALDDLGYTSVTVVYNPTGDPEGVLRVNSLGDEKGIFNLGSLIYNSFALEGVASESEYNNIIKTVMALKPLQVVVYDKISVLTALAVDDSYALAFDANYTLAIDNL